MVKCRAEQAVLGAEASDNMVTGVNERHSAPMRFGTGKIPDELAVDVSALRLLAAVAHELHNTVCRSFSDWRHPSSHILEGHWQKVLIDLQGEKIVDICKWKS